MTLLAHRAILAGDLAAQHDEDRPAELHGGLAAAAAVVTAAPAATIASDADALPDSACFLARIAGLPADTLDPESATRLAAPAQRLDGAEQALDEARAALREEFYTLVPHADPALRALLLDLRRRCFNRRSVAGLTGSALWRAADERLGGQLSALAALETAAEAATAGFAADHAAERAREGDALLTQLPQREVWRALCLASRDLAASVVQIAAGNSVAERRRSRTEVSVYRYLSRATHKLSPFANLTRIALGSVCGRPAGARATAAPGGTSGPGSAPPVLRLCAHDRWQQHSLVRARRDLLDSVAALVIRHPDIQADLLVRLNDTLKEEPAGRFRLIRPMQYTRPTPADEFRWAGASFISAGIGGPVPGWLLSELRSRPLPYAEVARRLAASFAEEGSIADPADLYEVLDELLSIGFLQLETPWPSHAIRLEDAVLAFLAARPDSHTFAPLISALQRLREASAAFPRAADAAAAVQAMDASVRHLADSVGELFPGVNPMPAEVDVRFHFYQDVFITAGSHPAEHRPAGDRPAATAPPPVEMSAATLDSVLSVADPLWRLASFFHPRWNFQHTLAAHAAERLPACSTGAVDLLDVFGGARQLWKDYVQWANSTAAGPFNPLALPAIDRLESLRRQLHDELRSAFGDALEVPAAALAAAAARIPAAYDPLVGACVYVQPADPAGDLWVLNRLFEGTGRFGSRFAAAMPGALQHGYVGAFTAASTFQAAGETVELLDILYPRENTVNVHPPQTPRLLIVPGESTDLPRARQVLLSELRFAVDAVSELPVLRDSAGRRCLPCHMTPANGMHMPVLAKFLATFGPSSGLVEIIPGYIGVHTEGGITVAERLTIGPLVFRRQRWVMPTQMLPHTGPAWQAYRELPRWLAEHDMPSSFYAIERVSKPDARSERFKPQFIDLASTVSCELFTGILGRQEEITLEEALPAPTAFPTDDLGRRWGIELMLDSLVLNGGQRNDSQREPLKALAVSGGVS